MSVLLVVGFLSQELDKREEKAVMCPRLSALARLNHFAVTELRGSDESYKPSPLEKHTNAQT